MTRKQNDKRNWERSKAAAKEFAFGLFLFALHIIAVTAFWLMFYWSYVIIYLKDYEGRYHMGDFIAYGMTMLAFQCVVFITSNAYQVTFIEAKKLGREVAYHG